MSTTNIIRDARLGPAAGLDAPRSSESSVDRVNAAGWRDYYQLTKPTISMLVVVTVVPSLLLAAGTAWPDALVSAVALIGTWLAAASAAVFNQLIDSDIDSEMMRTRARPLPSGRISAPIAAALGALLGIASFVLLYSLTTPLAAWVALAANAFYVLVYTAWLKRRTVQNIVIGGAAGAVGPLIGWAAVTGDLAWPAWVLFAIICLWTPPHFWALALKYVKDYAAAGVPMMPVVRGEESTRWQMFVYTLTLIPAVASLTVFGVAGWTYFVLAMGMTIWFAVLAWRLYRSHASTSAMPLFHYSCFYLFGVFGALTMDQLMLLVLGWS